MNSCIYEGWVRHRRLAPVENSFTYSLFMMYLDLAELPTLFQGRWLWSCEGLAPARFCRKDHLGDRTVPLDKAVRDLAEGRTGKRPRGPIRLLTHLRYFGYCFNPVSFYYCFDPDGRRVETIVAEVMNTPWGERHCYVLGEDLDVGNGRHLRYRFQKEFHVSPFMEMDMAYDWLFTEPGPNLNVHMAVKHGPKLFDATMALNRREIGTAALTGALARYPFMTLKVVAAIHFQALRLYLKRCPFIPHPRERRERVGVRA